MEGKEIASPGRRRFFGTAAGAVAAATVATQLGMSKGARAETVKASAAASAATLSSSYSFGPVQQIDAGELNVGYVDIGPADGTAVMLLHGWPYDIYSYAQVAPLLADAGYRVIVPFLRGYGSTTFLSSETFRNGQQSVLAVDSLALMDALGIGQAVFAGFDWGGRAADIVAALWPERCKGLVSADGYLIVNRTAYQQPLLPAAELNWWFQYYFATERGVLGLQENRSALAQLIWQHNSPDWNFDQATFDQTAAAFDNPDYVSVVVQAYRWRLGLAPGDPQLDGIENELAQYPAIGVPAITIDGASDPFEPAGDGASYRVRFTGKYEHRTLQVGHNPPQEDPQAFAQAVIDVDNL